MKKAIKKVYKNPILHMDYSDPDVIRVGEDFFMTASSFTYFPGLPILHSKDLVNWKVVSYALEKMPYETYDLPAHGKGVWAPAIRYHKGEYFIYFGAPDEGIFMVKTKNPFGKWEEPILVKEAKGWIDPCPFWDEDGEAYLVHAFAASRCGIKSILHINKMSSDGTYLLDEGVLVIDGRKDNPTLEGPKLYKRNGYYYIFAPAGGVESGWQSVFRSSSIYGPYEEKVVLAQGSTPINGPHQGGLVELENGEAWFVHFQDKEAYGRVVHLQPVKWVEDWPMMGTPIEGTGYLTDKYGATRLVDKSFLGQPVLEYTKPSISKENLEVRPATTDAFETSELGLQWQWQANPCKEWYDLEKRKGWLRFYIDNRRLEGKSTLYELPNVLTQMFPDNSFIVTTKVELAAQELDDACGLILTGESYNYVTLVHRSEGCFLEYRQGYSTDIGAQEQSIQSIKIEGPKVYLRAKVQPVLLEDKKAEGQFFYSIDGETFKEIGEVFYPVPGKWVGAKVGLFATNFEKEGSKGYADFNWIRIDEAR